MAWNSPSGSMRSLCRGAREHILEIAPDYKLPTEPYRRPIPKDEQPHPKQAAKSKKEKFSVPKTFSEEALMLAANAGRIERDGRAKLRSTKT